VTNPPIDPLREGSVMSLETRLPHGQLPRARRAITPHVLLADPILARGSARAARGHKEWPRASSLLFATSGGEAGMAGA
jgi:hypothetical protein